FSVAAVLLKKSGAAPASGSLNTNRRSWTMTGCAPVFKKTIGAEINIESALCGRRMAMAFGLVTKSLPGRQFIHQKLKMVNMRAPVLRSIAELANQPPHNL